MTHQRNIIGDVVVDEDSGEYTVQLSSVADGDSGSQPLRVTATGQMRVPTAGNNTGKIHPSFAAVISDAHSLPIHHAKIMWQCSRFSPEPNMSGNATITSHHRRRWRFGQQPRYRQRQLVDD